MVARSDDRITDKAALARVKHATERVPSFLEIPIADVRRFTIRAMPSSYYGMIAVGLCYRDFGAGVEDVLVGVLGATLGFRAAELEPVR